ncbi:Putative uncharacterized protein [Moritella viscosa]|uniref:hypothetical protein n=1 Tax=Moritella viscosa TaxID=80854 RepID=UPI000508ED57|nr:hypothetical protein [Moritella viscosa]CED59169.1 putative uncharacterized protein [Moritella viscosa]SHO00149.1 Putative uncharacterized protein [Moritella viscosa]SHO20237.1 Putative uncharacterized protein [Moritella viscosa]
MEHIVDDEKAIPESLSRLIVDYCDPLFISNRQNIRQKDVEKSNGTITYVMYKQQLWGITNSHVAEYESEDKILALHGFNTPPVNIGQQNTYGSFKSLRKEGDTTRPDIAVVKICDKVKSSHFDANSKNAINLDEWKHPNENEIITPVAFGFPTEHKYQNNVITCSPLVLATGRISGKWSGTRETFSFHAQLDKDSDFFLSGMSGGPIFHAEDRENNPLLIGIIYEGTPGSKEHKPTLFGLDNAIVSGYTVTPSIFEQWLTELGFSS